MADVAEEVVAACCRPSLVLAVGLGAATILNKRRKRKLSTWLKPDSENHLQRTTPFV